MKIAILTSARSGSTSLYHLIEESLTGYLCISEPFNLIGENQPGLNYMTLIFLKIKKMFLSKHLLVNFKDL